MKNPNLEAHFGSYYFLSMSLTAIGAFLFPSGPSNLLFWLSVLCSFLGIFLSPAFNSLYGGVVASTVLVLAGLSDYAIRIVRGRVKH
jgi:hypothetical protein